MKTRFLLALLFPVFSIAQVSLDKEIKLDSLKFETTDPNFIYSRIVKNYHTIQNEYIVTDYYKSGKIEMTGKSLDRDDLNKKGLFTYYFENGNRHELVNYQNSVRLGAYFCWYEDGSQKAVGEYLKNEKSEDTEGYCKINQFWDRNGIQKIIDGNGFYEDTEEEHISSQGKLKDGLKDSIWTGSDKRLKITFTEEYDNGKLVFGLSTDADGLSYNYKELITEARPAYGALVFRKSILKNIPHKFDPNLNGKSLILSFFIEKDGYIRDVRKHMGISPEIDTKAISLLQGATKWFPGSSRGVSTRKRYFFPIHMPRIMKI